MLSDSISTLTQATMLLTVCQGKADKQGADPDSKSRGGDFSNIWLSNPTTASLLHERWGILHNSAATKQ